MAQTKYQKARAAFQRSAKKKNGDKGKNKVSPPSKAKGTSSSPPASPPPATTPVRGQARRQGNRLGKLAKAAGTLPADMKNVGRAARNLVRNKGVAKNERQQAVLDATGYTPPAVSMPNPPDRGPGPSKAPGTTGDDSQTPPGAQTSQQKKSPSVKKPAAKSQQKKAAPPVTKFQTGTTGPGTSVDPKNLPPTTGMTPPPSGPQRKPGPKFSPNKANPSGVKVPPARVAPKVPGYKPPKV